jgi:hypothetical protein
LVIIKEDKERCTRITGNKNPAWHGMAERSKTRSQLLSPTSKLSPAAKIIRLQHYNALLSL